MLSYNETISICAQQENPFVENKPYNPDHVLSFLVTHMLDGLYPAPGDSEAADYLKKLYITAIQVLMEKEMPVIEMSIVQMRDAILERVNNITPISSGPEQAVVKTGPAKDAAESAPARCYATNLKESVHFNIAGKSITVQKQWMQWGVIVLLILLLIKIFK